MDPNKSLDDLVKQLKKPRGGSYGGKGAGAQRSGGAGSIGRQKGGGAGTSSRRGGALGRQGGGGGGAGGRVKLVRRKAGLSLQTKSSSPAGKKELAQHVQAVMERRRQDSSQTPLKAHLAKQTAARQAVARQGVLNQRRGLKAAAGAAAKSTMSAKNPGRLTVQINNSGASKASNNNVEAARKSVARARTLARTQRPTAPTTPLRGMSSSHLGNVAVMAPPSTPLTISIANESVVCPVATTLYNDSDLERDETALAILEHSVRQKLISPAPSFGLGIDVSSHATSVLGQTSMSLHARFSSLQAPAASVGFSLTQTRMRTVLG